MFKVEGIYLDEVVGEAESGRYLQRGRNGYPER